MKLSEQLKREQAFVQCYLGSRQICTCGATLNDYAERCSAGLQESCPGFVTIENARNEFRDLAKESAR